MVEAILADPRPTFASILEHLAHRLDPEAVFTEALNWNGGIEANSWRVAMSGKDNFGRKHKGALVTAETVLRIR